LAEALALVRYLGNRQREGSCVGNLANINRQSGALSEARQVYRRALQIAQQLGDRLNEGLWQGNLGALDTMQGRFDEAAVALERALAIAEEIGDRRRQGIWRGNRATLKIQQGLLGEATKDLEHALRLAVECRDRRFESLWAAELGWVLHLQDNVDASDAQLEHSVALAATLGDRWTQGSNQLIRARVARHRGLWADARVFLASAQDNLATIADHVTTTQWLIEQCHHVIASGDMALMKTMLCEIEPRVAGYRLESVAMMATEWAALERVASGSLA